MIIVTGGAGFIGSAVVWALNQRGESDIIIVDRLGQDGKWKNLVNLSFADYIDHDVFLDMVQRDSLPRRPRAIVHMGACSATTELDADYLMRNNVVFTKALCDYCLKAGIRLVHASSAATYGDGGQGFSDAEENIKNLRPLNMYGYSKHLFDLWTLREKITNRIVSLKFFNVYGPNEYHKGSMRSMICKAFEEIKETGRIKLFKSNHPDFPDGAQMRDFVYVKDCVNAICWLLENDHVNGIFNMGTGKARTWNDLAAAVFSALDKPVAIDYVEMPDTLKSHYQNFTEAEMAKIDATGLPRQNWHSLEQGVRDYIQNYLLQENNPYLGNKPGQHL